jgi:D-aspartate ligase
MTTSTESLNPTRADDWPAAIVLCSVLTGLSTVRALAAHNVKVHALIFDAKDPIKVSICPSKVVELSPDISTADLVDFIHRYAQRLGGFPVLMATSDKHTLALALHAPRLKEVCRTWLAPYPVICSIIHKEQLYKLAQTAGVPVIPWTECADPDAVERWSMSNAGPYLMKPSYEGGSNNTLKAKNKALKDADALRAHLHSHGGGPLLVQRLIDGGDGEIYDAYGLCDEHGRVLTVSTHRRWRQNPPNLGTTTFGEIPVESNTDDATIIAQTRTLLQSIRYHGIFGIEWLRETSSGNFYLIDFNARPFSSIGHLRDCGVNLPYLGYKNLAGAPMGEIPAVRRGRQIFWIDLLRDLRSRLSIDPSVRPPVSAWLATLASVRSFAYWDRRDPGPALQKAIEFVSLLVGYGLKRLRARASAASSHWPIVGGGDSAAVAVPYSAEAKMLNALPARETTSGDLR